MYLQKQALQKLQTGKDSLAKQLQAQQRTLKSMQIELSSKIEHNQQQAEKGFTALHQNLSERTLYWSLGALLLLLLGGGVYYWLSKRIRNNQTNIEAQLHKTKLSLEEETVKLDNKLVELLESQLKVREATPVVATENAAAPDHSLALKVADEIVRMQKNIAKMSDDVKGLKPLLKGIERIQNNFLANGYEMINLLNKDYDERMNIDVINFITDKNLPEGRKVISAVIKPQVNYNGVLIQRAQVDVSQN